MATNAKKLTYDSSTPVLVDYAEKDSKGNNITTEYLHAKDLSINSDDNATVTLKTLTLGGVTYLVNSQDSKGFEVIDLKAIVPSFNPSSDYTEESPLTITLDAETFNKLHRENIILKAPSCLNTELSSVFYIPSEKQSVMNVNVISFRCIQFSETMAFGSYYDDIYFETIAITDTGGTYALGYMSKIITNQSKYNISVSGDTLTIKENY